MVLFGFRSSISRALLSLIRTTEVGFSFRRTRAVDPLTSLSSSSSSSSQKKKKKKKKKRLISSSMVFSPARGRQKKISPPRRRRRQKTTRQRRRGGPRPRRCRRWSRRARHRRCHHRARAWSFFVASRNTARKENASNSFFFLSFVCVCVSRFGVLQRRSCTDDDDDDVFLDYSKPNEQKKRTRKREILESFAFVTKNVITTFHCARQQYPLALCVCVCVCVYNIHTYDTVNTEIHARVSNDEFCSRCFVARVGVQKKGFFFFFFYNPTPQKSKRRHPTFEKRAR